MPTSLYERKERLAQILANGALRNIKLNNDRVLFSDYIHFMNDSLIDVNLATHEMEKMSLCVGADGFIKSID